MNLFKQISNETGISEFTVEVICDKLLSKLEVLLPEEFTAHMDQALEGVKIPTHYISPLGEVEAIDEEESIIVGDVPF